MDANGILITKKSPDENVRIANCLHFFNTFKTTDGGTRRGGGHTFGALLLPSVGLSCPFVGLLLPLYLCNEI